jgi:4-amino-4-deoxy-L-arabinose transferase-like glycosyltransferase
VTLGGAYLRLANLNGQSFWVDELNHVVAAQALLQGKGAVFPSGLPYHRSLFFTKLVSYSFAAFGSSEFSARFPSAIFGVLSIPLIFFVAARLFRHIGVGFVAAFLQAFTPFNIGWSRVSRMYAIFQFFFLLAAYAIYEGLEGAREKKPRVRLFAAWNLDVFWLAIAALALGIATYLQVLSGVLLPGLLFYFSVMSLGMLMTKDLKSALTSKYILFIALSLLGVAGIAFAAPDILAQAREAMQFSPNWAQYDYVQNPFYYFWFLISNFYFTIAAFFLIGVVIAVAELRKSALYLLSLFIVPLALLSTLFVLKVERYIFHLFPFYLIIAAYGAVRFFEFAVNIAKESSQRYLLRSPKLVTLIIAVVFLGILGASDWLRFARKIPSLRAGTNGAVTHEEWSDACAFVRKEFSAGQPVISTLPVAVYHYLGHVDYMLANMENGRGEEIIARDGAAIDYYSNARVIDTLEDLQHLMKSQPYGWLIVDLYRFSETRYVRPEVKTFIENQLQRRYMTPENTVAIYSW